MHASLTEELWQASQLATYYNCSLGMHILMQNNFEHRRSPLMMHIQIAIAEIAEYRRAERSSRVHLYAQVLDAEQPRC